VERLPSAEVRHYWQQRFEPMSESMKATFREPILNKITEFVAIPSCRHLLGQAQGNINLADAMNTGKMLLVKLAKGRLGEHAHTLANLVFAKLQFDVLARADLPVTKRRLFTIFCDEVQNIAENDLATLLAEGRKFGVSLISAYQYADQLPVQLRSALLSAGSTTLFRVSHADAVLLAPELSSFNKQRMVMELTSLAQGEAITRIGVESAVRVRIQRKKSAASETSVNALREALRAGSHIRETIEADIVDRQEHLVSEQLTNHANEFEEGQPSWR
jgi:hypothetical protein